MPNYPGDAIGSGADPDIGTGGAGGAGWEEIPSPIAQGFVRVAANTTATIQMRIGSTGAGGGTGTIRQQAGQTSVSIVEIKD